MCQISYYLGMGYSRSKICKKFNLSKRSLRLFFKKLSTGFSNLTKNNQPKYYLLNEEQRRSIKNMVENDPFTNTRTIRNQLGIKCSSSTILRYLKLNKIKSYWATEGIYISQLNKELKNRFAIFWRFRR